MPINDFPVLLETVARWLDLAGLAVFAVSGALVAARGRQDIVAAAFFAIITATGGGTLRDLLIGAPVFWMSEPTYVAVCLGVAVVVWIAPLRLWPARAIEWFDAAGLAAFSVYGAAKALGYGVSPLPAAAMGVVTACVGGVIRDVVAGAPSVLLQRELYVTTAMAASGLYVGGTVLGLPEPWPMLAGAAAGFLLRGAAIQFGLALPGHKG